MILANKKLERCIEKSLKKYWIKLNIILKQNTNDSDDSDDKYWKSRINCDDDIPVSKTLKVSKAVMLSASVFNQVILKVCMYSCLDKLSE